MKHGQDGEGSYGDYDGSNTTGFVSPAGDALEGPIDLSLLLDLHRPHRYPVRVLGDALAERGILPGDILIAIGSPDQLQSLAALLNPAAPPSRLPRGLPAAG